MAAVMEAAQPISESVVDDLIRTWRIARLSKGSALGWSSNSIFGRLVEMGPFAAAISRTFGSVSPLDWENAPRFDRDAFGVQKVVQLMAPELRGPFEAFHIGVIRGQSCRGEPHKVRALILGLERSTYYDRINLARRFLQLRIGEYVDLSDT